MRKRNSLKKRYYIGSPKMLPGTQLYETWASADLNETIERAKKKCEDEGQDQLIVEIIRMVKVPKPPVKVERF